jgi:hypothetical protein
MRTIFPAEAEGELKRSCLPDIERDHFVEVGANQAEPLQTFDLEQHGRTAVLIEPQPSLADDLRRRRSGEGFCGSLLLSAEFGSAAAGEGSRARHHSMSNYLLCPLLW